jgi:hypothetical protein
MSALPLFWPEGDVSQGLDPEKDRRAPIIQQLSDDYHIAPLDFLSDKTLAPVRRLVLVQPRALQPAELVALDDWVRKGGQLLIFADPLLEWPSQYPLGDKRRPQPSTLLDPLFLHWGLKLTILAPDPDHPVHFILGGKSFESLSMGQWESDGKACKVAPTKVEARCSLGAGKAILVADADILNLADASDSQGRVEAVKILLDSLSKTNNGRTKIPKGGVNPQIRP